ncbi:MAG: choice-of-anchor B family protein, partial [Candidatus Marinimicrobia bacterium]|nr:choice-of-anchor B family protein [Candidatus Neomarinimicrobiota bacterium]
MRKLIFFIPFILLAESLLHPDARKNRDHNSLGFGVSGDVAISEGVFYVGQTGSSLNNGSIYIYSSNGIGGLDQEEIMAPIQGELGFDFGYSISVHKDLMIVGAPHRTDLIGKAFLYNKENNGQWSLIKLVQTKKRFATPDFGSEVAIGEHQILIADRNANDGKGVVFTFSKNKETGVWEERNTLSYKYINIDGLFGHSIAIKNNLSIIGSRNGNVAISFKFDSAIQEWEENHIFMPNNNQSGSRFGFSVDLSDDYIIIGAPGYDEKGLVELYKINDDSWENLLTISNPDGIIESYFGAAISIENDKILIGNFNGEKSFLFSKGSGDFVLKSALASPSKNRDGKFGRSLDMVDGKLIIGATYGENAYIYKSNDKMNWVENHSVSSNNREFGISGQKSKCINGKAGDFSCKSIDLLSLITPKDLNGGNNTELNDIWGWIDSTTGKEYALVGLLIGTSFVDVSDPVNPIVLGFLPTTTNGSLWRDMKVYKDHVFVVADNAGNHGVQIFDLTQLRGVTEFTEFSMTYHYDLVGSVHNIAINEETGFAYAVGIGSASKDEYMCGAHIIDINDPANPTYAGCLGDKTTGRYNDGYIHDGQFVIYKGPDSDYYGQEIAFTCNETALGIADVTDKSNLKIISKFEVTNNSKRYIHQGWLSEDQKYFFVNDELNELRGLDNTQNTLIFDLTDLDNPKMLSKYDSGLKTIDHNNYVVGDFLYQSNYSAGLRVLYIKDPIQPTEVAYFDTYSPGNKLDFVGAWGNYPYFNSGTILVSSIEDGLFILKATDGGNMATKT